MTRQATRCVLVLVFWRGSVRSAMLLVHNKLVSLTAQTQVGLAVRICGEIAVPVYVWQCSA